MSSNAEVFFEKAPDAATKSKISVFVKYFGIYFKLMNNIRENYAKNSTIKYIDLFCGRGFFEYNNEIYDSTPIEVIKNIDTNGYKNVEFYFNDLNKKNYLLFKNRVEKDFPHMIQSINIYNKDAKEINISKLVNSNDITISLLDPFGYSCLTKEYVDLLTRNKFSDLVCYLNYSHINRYIDNEKEKDNYKTLFGNMYDDVVNCLKNPDISSYNKANFVLKAWINELNSDSYKKTFLPIFIHSSDSKSKIESIVVIISKKSLGLIRLKSMLKDFEIFEGKFYSYINSKSYVNNLFADEEYKNIYDYIGDSFLNSKQLLELIDKKMMNKMGFLSAYSEEYIKKQLQVMERKNIIEIEYRCENRKRKPFTYGENTYFKRK